MRKLVRPKKWGNCTFVSHFTFSFFTWTGLDSIEVPGQEPIPRLERVKNLH